MVSQNFNVTVTITQTFQETAPPPLLVDSSSNTCPVDKDQLGNELN